MTELVSAVIYARYSSHSQSEQSIEGQLHDNYAWAKQQGIQVVGEYIDRAQSGTRDARPDFQRMIADAAKRQFTMVIVWKLDRFARNRYDSAIYKAKLKKYGVRVVSVKEIISDSPEGIILEGLLESMAEYYSANLSQNIRRGQSASMAKGNFCGGTVPYGYKSQEGKLVIDDREAPVIRYLFEQYAQGVSKKEIIDELNRRGVRTRNGKLLGHTAFQRALSNTAYIGQYKYRGVVIPGLAQPIVEEATFNQVQTRLKLVARAPAAAKARTDYQLQGKVFCGMCGAPMIGECGRSHTGVMHHYYTCATRKKNHACKKKAERKGFIEWYVVEQTMQYVLAPGRMEHVAEAVVAEYRKEFSNSRIGELERTLSQLDREQDKLLDALLETPKAMHKKIHDRMEALELQKNETSADLARLRIAQRIQLTEQEVTAWLRQFCNGDPLDDDFRRRVIDTFINAVYLYDDRMIVFYNIRGGKQVSYMDLISATDLSADDSSAPTSHAPGSDLVADGVREGHSVDLLFLFKNIKKGVDKPLTGVYNN